MHKVSIRFFNDREIRAVWDDAAAKWWFSVLDVVGALNGEPDYAKTRNYWKYLKAKLKREKSELVSATTQLKLAAADGNRTKNISKSGFTFANALHFPETLLAIEGMPETTFDEIVDKYVEMNVAHPFMEGNGRSTRIWLDLMLKRSLKRCVDWSLVDKRSYLAAMVESVISSAALKRLLNGALTDKIDDREMFMKGVDYSYYYEEP